MSKIIKNEKKVGVCPVCGKIFKLTAHNKIYCCDKCTVKSREGKEQEDVKRIRSWVYSGKPPSKWFTDNEKKLYRRFYARLVMGQGDRLHI